MPCFSLPTMSFQPPEPRWISYTRNTMKKASFYTLPQWWKHLRSAKPRTPQLGVGSHSVKREARPSSVISSIFGLKHQLPSGRAPPYVWGSSRSRSVNPQAPLVPLPFPLCPFLYHHSHSALDLLSISASSSDCFGFCSLSHCPRGSGPQQSFPFGIDGKDWNYGGKVGGISIKGKPPSWKKY